MSLRFLIDGYNVIKQVDSLKDMRNLRDARCALFRIIQTKRLLKCQNNQVTIVFDGKDNSNLYPKQKQGLINIVFSKDESADEVIKTLVQDSLQPRQMVVVTDDKAIIFFIRSLGAKAISVAEFLKKEQKQFLLRKQISKRNVESLKAELTYRQQEEINQELREFWK